MEPNNGGWTKVQKKDGNQGLVPTSYLSVPSATGETPTSKAPPNQSSADSKPTNLFEELKNKGRTGLKKVNNKPEDPLKSALKERRSGVGGELEGSLSDNIEFSGPPFDNDP